MVKLMIGDRGREGGDQSLEMKLETGFTEESLSAVSMQGRGK